MKQKIADLEEVKRQNEQYKRDIHECNNQRKELQAKFEAALKEHER